MFDDKGLSNSKSELILDFIYLSFFQTFKGLYAMLEKKHYKDESLEIKLAISDLIHVLSKRSSIYNFKTLGIKYDRKQALGGGGSGN